MAVDTYSPMSTFIADAQFDDEQQIMTVTTVGGRSYDTPMTPDQWQSFKQAPSAGRWYRQMVLGKF